MKSEEDNLRSFISIRFSESYCPLKAFQQTPLAKDAFGTILVFKEYYFQRIRDIKINRAT